MVCWLFCYVTIPIDIQGCTSVKQQREVIEAPPPPVAAHPDELVASLTQHGTDTSSTATQIAAYSELSHQRVIEVYIIAVSL